MACVNCGTPNKFTTIEVCKVCLNNNNDNSKKPVFWCTDCKAYICREHEFSWGERIVAATIEHVINPIAKLIKRP